MRLGTRAGANLYDVFRAEDGDLDGTLSVRDVRRVLEQRLSCPLGSPLMAADLRAFEYAGCLVNDRVVDYVSCALFFLVWFGSPICSEF